MGKDQYFLRNLCSNFGPFYRKLPSLWGVQDGAFRRGSGEAGTFTSRMSRKETGWRLLTLACIVWLSKANMHASDYPSPNKRLCKIPVCVAYRYAVAVYFYSSSCMVCWKLMQLAWPHAPLLLLLLSLCPPSLCLRSITWKGSSSRKLARRQKRSKLRYGGSLWWALIGTAYQFSCSVPRLPQSCGRG